MSVKHHREAIIERKHDHGNFCLKTSAVGNIVIFRESTELFQNLANVNFLTEKKEHKMKY